MKRLCCLILVICLMSEAKGDILPMPGSQPVDPVFDTSAVVCSCVVLQSNTVSSTKEMRAGKIVIVQSVEATMQITDVYKGQTIEPNQELVVRFTSEIPITGNTGASVAKNERGLMFLLHTADGKYSFADPYLGAVPLNGLPSSSEGIGIVKLQNALVQDLSKSGVEEQGEVLNLLQGIRGTSDQESTVLQQTSLSTSTTIAFKSIAVLMKSNPVLATARLAYRMRQGDTSPDGLVSAILTTQLTAITNPEAKHNLEELTGIGKSDIRSSAVFALRHVGDRASVPVLIRVLDDMDEEVKYQAVIALAEITGLDGEYAPNMEVFSKNPNMYIKKWKEWSSDQTPDRK